MADRLTEAQLSERFRHEAVHETMPPGWTPVGAWVRVSSGKQDEANQVPAVIRYCTEHRYWPARWYVVHGKSAYHGKHETDLNRAVTDTRDGIIKVLVIWHSDRLERRHERGKESKNLFNTLADFADAGGRVESVQEPTLGKFDMGGEVSTFIAGIMNHEKSKHISDQTSLGLDKIKANGAIYNRAPWGYTLTGDKYNKRLTPTGMGREWASKIFQRCIDGQSLRQIAAWLDSEGVPTPKNSVKWNESSVRWLIKNRAYAGSYQDRTGKPVQKCEALVRPSVFDRANAALKSRPKRGPSSDSPSMLAGLKCARCGSPMYRIKAGTTVKHLYYRCAGSGAQRKGCGNLVDCKRAEWLVIYQTIVHSTDPHQKKTWVEGSNWDDEISDTKQEIREAAEAERFDLLPALQTRLTDLRSRESVPGHYELTDTGMTVGEHFSSLDDNGKREYLKSRDIRIEKADPEVYPGGMRIYIDGQESHVTVRWNQD